MRVLLSLPLGISLSQAFQPLQRAHTNAPSLRQQEQQHQHQQRQLCSSLWLSSPNPAFGGPDQGRSPPPFQFSEPGGPFAGPPPMGPPPMGPPEMSGPRGLATEEMAPPEEKQRMSPPPEMTGPPRFGPGMPPPEESMPPPPEMTGQPRNGPGMHPPKESMPPPRREMTTKGRIRDNKGPPPEPILRPELMRRAPVEFIHDIGCSNRWDVVERSNRLFDRGQTGKPYGSYEMNFTPEPPVARERQRRFRFKKENDDELMRQGVDESRWDDVERRTSISDEGDTGARPGQYSRTVTPYLPRALETHRLYGSSKGENDDKLMMEGVEGSIWDEIERGVHRADMGYTGPRPGQYCRTINPFNPIAREAKKVWK